jgi:hypothetical protein
MLTRIRSDLILTVSASSKNKNPSTNFCSWVTKGRIKFSRKWCKRKWVRRASLRTWWIVKLKLSRQKLELGFKVMHVRYWRACNLRKFRNWRSFKSHFCKARQVSEAATSSNHLERRFLNRPPQILTSKRPPSHQVCGHLRGWLNRSNWGKRSSIWSKNTLWSLT